MDSYKVLRKLEIIEVMKNRLPIASNVISTLRLATNRVDLFAHLDQLKQAVHTWKSTQPFLRAKVVPKDGDFYFVIDENSSANRQLENVHFLRIRSNLDASLTKKLIDENLVLDLALEKSLSEIINFDNNPDLLWNLSIIEVSSFTYELVWQISHVISDGVSIKENYLLLLDLIQRAIRLQSMPTPVDYGVNAGTMRIFEKERNSAPGFPTDVPKIFRPDFVQPEVSRKAIETKYDSIFGGKLPDQLDFELYDLNSSKTYLTLVDAIRLGREMNNMKPVRFDIPKETFQSLLKK